MKYFITHNSQTPTGYQMTVVNDDGQETFVPIEKTVLEKKTGINWLVLPENPMNRKLINPAKVDKLGKVELTYKESIVLRPRDNSQPRKKLEDYLTDEEKAIIEDLMSKAKARKEADKPKPLTEVEKAKIAAQKAQAKYEALLAKSNEEWHLRKEDDK